MVEEIISFVHIEIEIQTLTAVKVQFFKKFSSRFLFLSSTLLVTCKMVIKLSH